MSGELQPAPPVHDGHGGRPHRHQMSISWGQDGGLQGPTLGISEECLEYPKGMGTGRAA
ncbi:UNVERIFIED_CONTAM: hypothetical protein Sradi_1633400 [Sesamum radiatum]|uniref:Uncharacterized protein n=1 Tax=Sesamum radiatum TaxID=300843 RepID=A0AAW2UD78_SESRA